MKLYKLDIIRYNNKQLEIVSELMGFDYQILREFQGNIDICFDNDGFCVGRNIKKYGFLVNVQGIKSTKETSFTTEQLKARKGKRKKITRLDLRKYNYNQLEIISEILNLNYSDLSEYKAISDEVWFYENVPAAYTTKGTTRKIQKGLYVKDGGFQTTKEVERLIKGVKMTSFTYKQLKDHKNVEEVKAEPLTAIRDLRINLGIETAADWTDKAEEAALIGVDIKESKATIQKTINEILEKIGKGGMDSLTKKESDYLNENSKKL
jgi:hypothetical protein